MFLSLSNLLTKGRAPDYVVLHEAEGTLFWEDFSAAVSRCADYLQQEPAQRWLLCTESTADFSIWLLALIMAGKTAVLPPNAQAGTLAQWAHAYDAQIDAIDIKNWGGARGGLPKNLAASARLDLCTSGSTGAGKRISKSIAQLETEIAVLHGLWGEQLSGATMLGTVPHHHIYGLLFRVLWPLCAGMAFDCVLCAHPDTLQQRTAVFKPSVLATSPAQLSRWPDLLQLSAWQDAPRLIFSSGGALTTATAHTLKAQLGFVPIEVYGSTETGGIAWRQQDQDQDARWQPLPGVSLVSGAEGVILLSPFLGSEQSHVLDDMLEFYDDGRFRLLGRADRIVKVEEKRLSLPEMELNLLAHPWVREAATLTLEGSRERVAAVLVLNETGKEALLSLGRRACGMHLRAHLAAFYDAVLLPRHWRYVDELPWNAQGKLTVQALRELFV